MRFLILIAILLLFLTQLCVKVNSWAWRIGILCAVLATRYFLGPWWLALVIVLTVLLLVRKKPQPAFFKLEAPTRVVE